MKTNGSPHTPGAPIRLATLLAVAFAVSIQAGEADVLPAGTEAAGILKATGLTQGLCVVVGATDGRLLDALAGTGEWLVLGLATDPAAVNRVRGSIAPSRYGLASVRHLPDARRLPFRDRTINLLMVDCEALGAAAPDEAERLRVVAPLGAIHEFRNGRWSTTKVPMPDEMDGWTHFDHGPDGNPVSRDRTLKPCNVLQWHAGPIHSSGGRLPGPLVRLSGGHLAYAGQVAPFHAFHDMGNIAADQNELMVRDAFNGLPRWHRMVGGSNQGEVAILDGDEFFHAPNQRQGEFFARIDARTGKVLLSYDKGLVYAGTRIPRSSPRDWSDLYLNPDSAIRQRLVTNRLIQQSHRRLVVLDRASGAVVWQKRFDTGPAISFCMTDTAGQRLFVARGGDEDIRSPVKGLLTGIDLSHIEAYDIASGRALWTNDTLRPEQKARTTRLIFYDGVIYVPYSDEAQMSYTDQQWRFLAIDGATGRTLWHQDKYVTVGSTPASKHHPLAFGNLLAMAERNIRLYDRRTGAAHANAGVNIFGTSGCTTGRGAAAGFIFNGPIMVPVNEFSLGEPYVPLAYRSDCEIGIHPAYGMVFSPSGGYHSHNFYSGVAAWAHADNSESMVVPDEQRLERGPAFGAAAQPGSGGWIMHRGDDRRRSFSPEYRAAEIVDPLASVDE